MARCPSCKRNSLEHSYGRRVAWCLYFSRKDCGFEVKCDAKEFRARFEGEIIVTEGFLASQAVEIAQFADSLFVTLLSHQGLTNEQIAKVCGVVADICIHCFDSSCRESGRCYCTHDE